jgi:hypothetical protein
MRRSSQRRLPEVAGQALVVYAEIVEPADALRIVNKRPGIHVTVAGSSGAAFDGEPRGHGILAAAEEGHRLLTDERLPKGFTDDFACVVVESTGHLAFHGVFKLRSE